MINQNAMLYADEAIIPVSTDFLGLDALKKMLEAINNFNYHFEHNLKVTRIVPTLYDARIKSCRETLQHLQNDHYELLTEPVRTNSKIKEAPSKMKSIFTYAPSSRGAKDYESVVLLVLGDEATIRNNSFENYAVSHA
mgnify:CR=1 FL=1